MSRAELCDTIDKVRRLLFVYCVVSGVVAAVSVGRLGMVGTVVASGILKPRIFPWAAVSVMSPPIIWFL